MHSDLALATATLEWNKNHVVVGIELMFLIFFFPSPCTGCIVYISNKAGRHVQYKVNVYISQAILSLQWTRRWIYNWDSFKYWANYWVFGISELSILSFRSFFILFVPYMFNNQCTCCFSLHCLPLLPLAGWCQFALPQAVFPICSILFFSFISNKKQAMTLHMRRTLKIPAVK